MARFKVGDWVQTTVGHMACEVIAGPDPDDIYAIRSGEGLLFMRSGYGLEQVPPPDPPDADVLAGLCALSDAGQVQIQMTHVDDEGLPVYEVSWRKPGWSPPPAGPDIAAAHHSLGRPVARVLEMAQPYIDPPPDPRDAVVEAAVAYCDGLRGTSALYDAVEAYREAQP